MRILPRRMHKLVAAGFLLVLLVSGGLWWKASHQRPRLVYTPEGYGGFAPMSPKREQKPADPLRLAENAYNAGRYEDAEALANQVAATISNSENPEQRKQAVKALYLLAFSAARRKDFELARERFQMLREEAAKLPDKVKLDTEPGQVSPTLEEQGAYQHAVCTAALGEKEAAEAEYIQFMRDYPESSLIYGAIRRIERLNDGRLPAEAEAEWKQAMETARARQEARLREQSLCGPECLAELLRRRGEKVDAHTLAEEMKTSGQGTSLQALAETAKNYGYAANGLSLTQKGLRKQPLPLIALVRPAHYVIVEKVTLRDVTVWDANVAGSGKPSTQRYSIKEWREIWSGVALVLQPSKAGTEATESRQGTR